MNASAHALKGPHFVVSTEGEILGEDTAENREIVRRIHACVNACEGISTEELEAGIIRDMCRTLADVVPLLQERNARIDNPADAQPSGATPRRIVVSQPPVNA